MQQPVWEGSIGLLVCWVVGLFQLGRKIDDCMGCCMLHYAFLSVCMAFSFSFLCRLNARGMSMLVCVTAHPWDGHVVDATIYLKHAGLSWFSLVVPALPSVSLFGMRVCGMMSFG